MSKGKYRLACQGCNRTEMCCSPPHKPRHLHDSSTAPVDPIPCPCSICIVKTMCEIVCPQREIYITSFNYYYDLESNVGYVYPRCDNE